MSRTGSRKSRKSSAWNIATSPDAAPKSATAGIQITDDAIIQLKERVVDRYYDPLQRIWRTLTRQKVRY